MTMFAEQLSRITENSLAPIGRQPSNSIVYVVDDDLSVRESLETLITRTGAEVETFDSAEKFLSFQLRPVPSCLLLDVGLPGMSGLELQERLSSRPDITVVILSGHADVRLVVRAMKSGALDALTKPLELAPIQEAVQAALGRSAVIRQKEAAVAALRDRHASLTPRERQVLSLVVSGLLNKQVGGELGITEMTVKSHRGQIMKKMRASSFADLVRMASVLESLPNP